MSLYLPFFWVVFNLSLTVLSSLSIWKRYFGFEDGSPGFLVNSFHALTYSEVPKIAQQYFNLRVTGF